MKIERLWMNMTGLDTEIWGWNGLKQFIWKKYEFSVCEMIAENGDYYMNSYKIVIL